MTTITGIDVGQTSANLSLADYGNDGTVEVQISPRDDFQFCVCPTYSLARGAVVQLRGLNQRSTYWAQARNRSAGGAVGDWSSIEAFRTLDGDAQYTEPQGVMIAPALLVIPIKPIELIANNTIAGYPIINLLRDAPVAWRATQESDGNFAIYLRTGGQPVDTVALLNTNLPEAATVTITGGGSQAGTYQAPSFSTGALPFRASPNLPQRAGYHGLFPLGGVRADAWLRIGISNAQLTGGMIHVEHLVIGRNLAINRNIASDKTETATTLTTIDRKRSGIPDRVRGLPMRKVDFEIDTMTEQQFETAFGQLWRRENEVVLAAPNSRTGAFLHDRLLYGDLSGGRVTNPSTPRFSRQFTVNSLI